MPYAYPAPRFHQALLEDFTLTDGSGIVSTVADQTDGSCDITTNAVAGSFNFRLPITDFFGGPVDGNLGALQVESYVRILTANAANDNVIAGLRDNTAGNNLAGGMRQSGVLVAAGFGSSQVSAGSTSDRAVSHYLFTHGGKSVWTYYVFGYSNATTYADARGLAVSGAAFDPSHLYVQFTNVAATAQTMSVEVGFWVCPSVPDFTTNAARA